MVERRSVAFRRCGCVRAGNLLTAVVLQASFGSSLVHLPPVLDTTHLPNGSAIYEHLLRSGDQRLRARLFAEAVRLQRRRAGPAAARDGARTTGSDASARIIHVLSMGRVGSSFVCLLLSEAGIPCINEPFWGKIEGKAITSDSKVLTRERCMYGLLPLNGTCAKLFNVDTYARLEKLHGADISQFAFKTTRVVDGTAVATAMQEAAHTGIAVKLLLVLRDPRAIKHSMMPHPNWAVFPTEVFCKLLRKEVDSLPDIVKSAGPKLKLLTYEKMASNLTSALHDVADFLDMPFPEEWAAHKTHSDSVNKWWSDLDPKEIQQVEDNEDCAAYMEAMNYPRYNVSEAPNYSNVKVFA